MKVSHTVQVRLSSPEFLAAKVGVFASILLTAMMGFPVQSRASVILAGTGSQNDVQTAVTAAKPGDTVQIPAGVFVYTSTVSVTNGVSLLGAGINSTIIVDEVPRNQQHAQVFIFAGITNQNIRFSGLTLKGGTTNTTVNYNGLLAVWGSTRSFRVDHLKFDNPRGLGIYADGHLYGVIDHCFFDLNGNEAIQVYHNNWNEKNFGDGSWADSLYWGTEKAIYIEDNIFQNGNYNPAVDAYGGSRWVFRYNSVTNDYVGNHGTDSSQRYRSSRSCEIYNNTFYWPPTAENTPWPFAIYLRGGTGVIWSNSFSGRYTSILAMANYRSTTNPDGYPWKPWGPAIGGTNVWDGNTDANGYPCLDQVGRGTGDLLSGSPATPAAWPHEILDPVYQWGNTLNGVTATGGSQQVVIQPNRDWYDNVARPGYKPFVYPHPLVSGADLNRPSPPSNLRVVAGP
jgi:hypothetical protein